MKAKKNPTEIAGMRNANIRDSAVLADFLAFLQDQVLNLQSTLEILYYLSVFIQLPILLQQL